MNLRQLQVFSLFITPLAVVALCATANGNQAEERSGPPIHKILKKCGVAGDLVVQLSPTLSAAESKYRDGRPEATLRMDAKDHGIVLRYGDGPDRCDMLGARDVWVFEDHGTYYMHYEKSIET